MNPTIESHILDYLRFGEQTSFESSNGLVDALAWKHALAFTDAAGLSLHLRDRLIRRHDFAKLPVPIQIELERRHRDNVRRIEAMLPECVRLNRMLQDADIHCLNLKGFSLAPDFVESLEKRAQYDYDFLVRKEDLKRAYTLFLQNGYAALHSTRELAADHCPTLIQKTGWQWKGNYYDPAIPRGVELHFQLWDPDFELLPIQILDKVWERSCRRKFGSIEAPTLCEADALLYVTLHAFRHLLRNDLRLSHLYEIAFFLQRTSDRERFWEEWLAEFTHCRNTTKIVVTTFELARHLFGPVLSPPICHTIERHLPATAASWIRVYGRKGAIHCYRKNRNALLLHLGLMDDSAQRWALVRRRLLPRHLPLPTYGVQTPPQAEDLKFRAIKTTRYLALLVQRSLFHMRSLTELLFQLPVWLIHMRRHLGIRRRESSASCHR